MHNEDGSRGRIMHLHTRLQELTTRDPVTRLHPTPGLGVRRDTSCTGARGYTEQEVTREEADKLVHFCDWFPGAIEGFARVSRGKVT
jgi:hypothetical protein